jgi:CheY-like chemotaxis protein
VAGKRGSAGVTVLVVEDDEAVAAVVQAWLRADPRIVRVAQVGTVAAARAWLAEEHPDVVVLDYALPDGTAADVMAALRLLECVPAVVLHTSSHDHAELGRALGCQDAVRKGDWATLADRLLALTSGAGR